jgi:hypothetical protein
MWVLSLQMENKIDVVPWWMLMLVALILVMAAALFWKNNTRIKGGQDAKFPKKERTMVCPFSKGSNFLVETAEHLPPTPLDLFQDWATPGDGPRMPLAARWLAAGISGQDTPGMLRAGLKRLRNSKYFLVQEKHLMREELRLKKKALEERHSQVFCAEPDSLEAQRECLELFVDYLPKRYPDLYSYDNKKLCITVKPVNTTFLLDDWWNTRPLELCERIVQEDLILMRPSFDNKSFMMAAAAVVFSFNELQEKLGQPAEIIHAPVPGFEKHIQKSVNLTFSKLKPQQPMWRNNWGIAPTGTLDEPIYGSAAAHEHRAMTDVTQEDVKAKYLKVEYQTIRRLPKSGYLLFTVRTMVDPMYELEKVPRAASCLAASIRGMSPAMRKYKGIDDEPTCKAVLAYLDSIGEPPALRD